MKTTIIIITLCLFIWLAHYSYGYTGHGYYKSEISNIDRLLVAQQYTDDPNSKIVYLYGEDGRF